MSVTVLTGDCRDVLRTLPDQSVHCIVTSPPYYGLRDYGVDGQIGLEQTPDAYVAEMVEVFREARRVLRDDGTLFLNLGDSYCNTDKWGGGGNVGKNTVADDGSVPSWAVRRKREAMPGLKPKDLIGIPWAVATALRDPFYSGRIKRIEDRVWLAAMIDAEGCFFIHKRKAGTPSYSKFARADGTEANYVRAQDTFGVGLEISNTSKAIIDRVAEIVPGGTFTTQGPAQNARRKQTIYRWRLSPNATKELARELYPHLVAKQHQARMIFNCPSTGEAGAKAHAAMMNLHNGIASEVDYPAPPSMFEPGWYLRQDIIWSKSNPMPESVQDRCTKAHEYVFLFSKSARYLFDAAAIAEPSIYTPKEDAPVSGAYSEGSGRNDSGTHLSGGFRRSSAPKGSFDGKRGDEAFRAITETRNKRSVWTITTKPYSEAHFATMAPELAKTCIMAGCPLGGTVLDPFGGAGTTGLVADQLSRNAILIELNPTYADLARNRISTDAGMFGEVA